MKGMKKAQAVHRKETPSEYPLLNQPINKNPIEFEEGMSRKEALKKFLLQRQVRYINKV